MEAQDKIPKKFSKKGLEAKIAKDKEKIANANREECIKFAKEIAYLKKAHSAVWADLVAKIITSNVEIPISENQTEIALQRYSILATKKHKKTWLYLIFKWFFKMVKKITPYEERKTNQVLKIKFK